MSENYFKLYLDRAKMSVKDIQFLCRALAESRGIEGLDKTDTTWRNWINNSNHNWQLTIDQWQVIADVFGITLEALQILLSGRPGHKKYQEEEVNKIMCHFRDINPTHPDYTIKYLIDTSPYNQTSLAKLLGVDVSTVQNWCSGRTCPKMDFAMAHKFSVLVNVSLQCMKHAQENTEQKAKKQKSQKAGIDRLSVISEGNFKKFAC